LIIGGIIERAVKWPKTLVSAVVGRARDLALVVGVMVTASACGKVLIPQTGYLAMGLLYLLAVLALSFWVEEWTLLATALVGGVIWNFFFIPPVHSFIIAKSEDRILFGLTVFVTVVAGHLMARLRKMERSEKLSKLQATALLHLNNSMSAASSFTDGLTAAQRHIDAHFSAETVICLNAKDGVGPPSIIGSPAPNSSESGLIDWVAHNRRNAGRFTDVVPNAAAYCVPIVSADVPLGVLAVRVKPHAELSTFQRRTVEAFASQIGIYIERDRLRILREREKLLAESDRLHRVLFDAVSHELMSPLTSLSLIAENIGDAVGASRRSMADELRAGTNRLRRLVNNLLDQARLESDAIRPRMEWCSVSDVANSAIENVRDFIEGHPLDVRLPDTLPLIRVDAALMEHVLSNLLLNAAIHTPSGTPISFVVEILADSQKITFTVADRGPGIPDELIGRLFKKFERANGAHVGGHGLGLGLSIVRGFVEAQGGNVVVNKNPAGGAKFTVFMPFVAHGGIPAEAA
jgi:two-component system sensor histidine kinase KdpD